MVAKISKSVGLLYKAKYYLPSINLFLKQQFISTTVDN